MTLRIVSFGERYHPELPGQFPCLDARCFPNPARADRWMTGLAETVAGQVLTEDALRVLATVADSLDVDDPPPLVGVFCVTGRHRSVAAVEWLFRELERRGRSVLVQHLDVYRGIE